MIYSELEADRDEIEIEGETSMVRAAALALVLSLGAALGSVCAPTTARCDALDVLQELSRPEVGKEVEVEVGQAVVSFDSYYVRPAITLAEPATTTAALGVKILLDPGVYFLVDDNRKGKYYQYVTNVNVKSLGITYNYVGGILIPSEPNAAPRAYWEKVVGLRSSGPLDSPKIEPVDPATQPARGFRSSLTYGGVSKGTVSLTYREFINDWARPAFTQGLSYDLAEGDEIGFRGARLKVLKATNTSLRYVVVRPLTAPR